MRVRLLLLVLALLGGACSGDPPAYLHRVYVDRVGPVHNGRGSAVVRFLAEDGSPAPAAEPSSLTPVALGEPVGRVRSVDPLRGQGQVVALVVAAHLPQGLFEPVRVGYRRVIDALGPADRVLLAAVSPEAEPRLLAPAAARRALDALAPPPGPEVLGPALAGRRRSGPVGWARAPDALLSHVFSVLASQAAAAPRRSVLVVLEGRSVGRSWTPFLQAAAATATDLHLIAVPPPSRTQMPGRIERPFYVYSTPDLAGLPAAFDAALEGVVGGHLLRFDADRRGLALADGFGVRTRLPRGGWEEFPLAAPETPPAILTLGNLEPMDGGRWSLSARSTDARGDPLLLPPDEVSLWSQHRRLELLPDAPPTLAPPALSLVLTVPESGDEAKGQALAAAAALAVLPASASALVATSGRLPFGPYAYEQDLPALRARLESEPRPLAVPARDLQADIQDLLRQLKGKADGTRKLLLIVTGTRPLRQARGRGRGTYRFRSLLHLLRRSGVTPLWVAVAPPADYDRLRPVLRSMAGGDLWVLPTWEDVPALTRRVVESVANPTTLVFRSDLSAEQLRTSLQARTVYHGYPVHSQIGLPRNR